MIRKLIKFVMIPHSGMFVVCSLLHGKHCFDSTKLHFSVLHFSVLAFVQANLALPSEYCFKYHTIKKLLIVLP